MMTGNFILLCVFVAGGVFAFIRRRNIHLQRREVYVSVRGHQPEESGTQPAKKGLYEKVRDGEIDLLGNIHIFVCVVWYLVIVLVLAPDIGGSGYWDWLSTGPKGVYLFLGLIFTWGFSSREPWTIWVYGLLMITTLALLGLSIWL
jgi:hypothetical protein